MLDAGAKQALAGTRFGDVRWFDSIDSTNRLAVELARDGAPEGLVVAADHQTAGRGRLDRRWEAPPGSSLLVSVLLRPPRTLTHLHLVSGAVGIAASDACNEVAGFRPRLKWPNDVVMPGLSGRERVDDKKLGGILAEVVDRAVVVGIGLNVNWPSPLPPELAGIATAANLVAGREVDRLALFVRLLERLEEHYGALCEAGGWRGVLLNYRRLCATLGRRVRIELPGDDVVVGKAVEVAVDGHLLVEVDGPGREMRRISVGDVVHLRPTD